MTFQRTFYSRFLPADKRTFDARQPLPALFAGRWINGSAADFRTSFKIWREGRTDLNAPCAQQGMNAAGFVETVIFDEEENPEASFPLELACGLFGPCPLLYATSLVPVTDTTVFARPTTGAVAGWVYFNLDNDLHDAYASQNWIITSMGAEGRASVDMEAVALGNGCTPPLGTSVMNVPGGVVIGPSANSNP